jgi:hypothetical protein
MAVLVTLKAARTSTRLQVLPISHPRFDDTLGMAALAKQKVGFE